MLITSILLVLQERYHIKYDPVHHRLRCTGHIINLVAQAFLFSTDKDALLEENNQDTSYLPTEREMENWRQKGPLGKLHNIVVHIQRSPQRVAAFLKLSSGKRLVRDNKTRWNSWYAMIDCAIYASQLISIVIKLGESWRPTASPLRTGLYLLISTTS